MAKVIAVVLAGGVGSRLHDITKRIPKSLVPLEKRCLIDYTISNCLNSSHVDKVYILAQTLANLLMEYVEATYINQGLSSKVSNRVAPHHTGKEHFLGTADAVRQFLFNRKNQNDADGDLLLVLSGDHLYQMDYNPLINFHRKHGCSVTVVAQEMTAEKAVSNFGVFTVTSEGIPTSIHEKPKKTYLVPLIPGKDTCYGSLGIYVFTINKLIKLLKTCKGHDFAKDTLPCAFKKYRKYPVRLFNFNGYWEDLGTVRSLWAETLRLLGQAPINMYDKNRPIHHLPLHLGSPKILGDDIILSDGCIIYPHTTVKSCVLSREVHIYPHAEVRECIFHDRVKIHAARLSKVIVCEDTTISDGVILGYNLEEEKNKYETQKVFFDESGIIVVPAGITLKP